MRKKLIVGSILIITLISFYYLYDELTNWQEAGEIARYILIGLPLGIIQFSLTLYSQEKLDYKNKKIVTVLGYIGAVVLLIPSYVIYRLFLY
jgi:hypothetical protein